MKTGISSLWAYINTRNNDELQRTDIIVALKRIEAEQAETIAAAVQAERDLARDSENVVLYLAEIVNDLPVIDLGNGDTITGRRFAQGVSQLAQTIRARSEAKS